MTLFESKTKQTEKDFYREIISRESAKTILSTDALQLYLEQPIRFSFGLESPVKLEADYISKDKLALRKTVNLLSLLMDLEHLQPDVIVGVISGAIPFARQLADLKGCRFAARLGHKRTPKQERQIEGIIKPGENALILDDISTSGGNIILAANDVRKEGGIVTHCLTFFDYGFPLAKDNFVKAGIQPYSAISFSEFLDLTQGRFNIKEIEVLRSWYQQTQEKQDSTVLYVSA